MEKMLDAGFCLPATCPLVPVRSQCLASGWVLHGRRVGFAYHSACLRHELRPNVDHGRGQAGMLVVKSYYPYFIQHPAFSIQYLLTLT
jgi:hypothetical protein